MAEKLLESDFLTVNLSKIFKGKGTGTGAKPGTAGAKSEIELQDLEIRGDMPWEEWLKRKQEENKKLPKEQQLSEYTVETEVFKEFYNEEWENDADLTKKLLDIGDLLRKAFKVLHFNAANNPFYNFLKGEFGKDLVKKGLLNASTFTAIFEAISNKTIVTSEFNAENNYNIIYCYSLYKKSPSDISKYLKLQADILKPNAAGYDAKNKLRNKEVFVKIKPAKAENENNKDIKAIAARIDKFAKAGQLDKAIQRHGGWKEIPLNDYATAKGIHNALGSKYTEDDTASVDSKEQKNLLDKLNSSAEIFAALQLLNAYSGTADVRKALSVATNHKNVSALSQADINAAQPVAAKIIPKGKIDPKDAKALASALLSKLQGQDK